MPPAGTLDGTLYGTQYGIQNGTQNGNSKGISTPMAEQPYLEVYSVSGAKMGPSSYHD